MTVTSIFVFFLWSYISSDEIQKGINAVQRCSIENQKGTIAVQSLWQYCSGFQWNIVENC